MNNILEKLSKKNEIAKINKKISLIERPFLGTLLLGSIGISTFLGMESCWKGVEERDIDKSVYDSLVEECPKGGEEGMREFIQDEGYFFVLNERDKADLMKLEDIFFPTDSDYELYPVSGNLEKKIGGRKILGTDFIYCPEDEGIYTLTQNKVKKFLGPIGGIQEGKEGAYFTFKNNLFNLFGSGEIRRVESFGNKVRMKNIHGLNYQVLLHNDSLSVIGSDSVIPLESVRRAIKNLNVARNTSRICYFEEKFFSFRYDRVFCTGEGNKTFKIGEDTSDIFPLKSDEGYRFAAVDSENINIYNEGNKVMSYAKPEGFERFDFSKDNLWLNPPKLKYEILKKCSKL